MPRPAKYEHVMAVIQQRIAEGDYLLRAIPGERKIAEETGVSYMTARRAVTELVNRNVLVRNNNGALEAHPEFRQSRETLKVVLLYPSFPSPHLSQLRWIVGAAFRGRDFSLRPVQYVHWNDPIIADALQHADGAIVIPSAERIPDYLQATFEAGKVVILDGDLSDVGIPSIQLFPDSHVQRVIDHLIDLGHRSIDCLNTQHRNREIDRRIALWKNRIVKTGIEGQLWDHPAASFSDPTPVAYDTVRDLVASKKLNATALVCTTYPAALAAIRVMWENQVRVGSDISICAVNLENHARYHCPSIAGLEMPDLSAVLDRCLNGFASDRPWRGSYLIEPTAPVFFAGESCGAPSTNT